MRERSVGGDPSEELVIDRIEECGAVYQHRAISAGVWDSFSTAVHGILRLETRILPGSVFSLLAGARPWAPALLASVTRSNLARFLCCGAAASSSLARRAR